MHATRARDPKQMSSTCTAKGKAVVVLIRDFAPSIACLSWCYRQLLKGVVKPNKNDETKTEELFKNSIIIIIR